MRPFLTSMLSFLVPSLGFAGGEPAEASSSTRTAVFAGGCFWCMEGPFERVPGVLEVRSGYTGGAGENPTYVDYAAKGHVEAVEVAYDPSKTSYERLLDIFWRQIDPTDPGGQFGDRGPHYRTVIFYGSKEEKKLAEASKRALEKSGRFGGPVVTEILPAGKFWPAEDYHQDYYKKNPLRYKMYRLGSGREGFLKRHWGEDPKGKP